MLVSLVCFFFFFKQKTAYEIMPSLVGSEMCIRDRDAHRRRAPAAAGALPAGRPPLTRRLRPHLFVLLRRGVPARLPVPPPGDRGVAQAPPRRGARSLRPEPRAPRRLSLIHISEP